MAKSPYELPEESLASLDEFGNRLFIYPAQVRGFFRKWRSRVYLVLILIFLALPWIKVGGYQSILLDLPRRQFTFFGLTFWAHDAPIIFFILGILTLSLAFFTALYGRVWCGWACPQTVFIDGLFRRIEEWFEGNHIERRKLDQAPVSPLKVFKKSGKWAAYTVASLIMTHSFLAYFVGTEALLEMVTRPPGENWTSFLIILSTTGIILFDFGWFREQFCIIMCPYGRIQSVLLDEHSLTVAYDVARGEPRKSPDVSKDQQGDCISCFKCVAVCPTAIDIRRGQQMECIACTACIDACDEVMEKINKPKGLIRYSTEAALKGLPSKKLRPRVFVYGILILVMFFGLFYSIGQRTDLSIAVIRAIEAPFRKIQQGGEEKILNQFKLHIKNQSFEPLHVQFKIVPLDEGESDASTQVPAIDLISPLNPILLKPGEDHKSQFFVHFSPELTNQLGRADFEIEFTTRKDGNPEKVERKPLQLIGPTGL